MDTHLLPLLLVAIALLALHIDAYFSRSGRRVARQDEVARRPRGEGFGTTLVPRDKKATNLE